MREPRGCTRRALLRLGAFWRPTTADHVERRLGVGELLRYSDFFSTEYRPDRGNQSPFDSKPLGGSSRSSCIRSSRSRNLGMSLFVGSEGDELQLLARAFGEATPAVGMAMGVEAQCAVSSLRFRPKSPRTFRPGPVSARRSQTWGASEAPSSPGRFCTGSGSSSESGRHRYLPARVRFIELATSGLRRVAIPLPDDIAHQSQVRSIRQIRGSRCSRPSSLDIGQMTIPLGKL